MQTRRNLDNYSTVTALMEEFFSPVKYGARAIGHGGTIDEPKIISRWVERKFKAWHAPDGSYHEELVEDSLPTDPEGTN